MISRFRMRSRRSGRVQSLRNSINSVIDLQPQALYSCAVFAPFPADLVDDNQGHSLANIDFGAKT
jgi:hypothetical protein